LGFQQVRIIHGKGIGFQRDVVRQLLATTPFVVEYGDDVNGNRGATWATLLVDKKSPPRGVDS
jgi:dsDNA-specific endonuclease/ATPase MutS2